MEMESVSGRLRNKKQTESTTEPLSKRLRRKNSVDNARKLDRSKSEEEYDVEAVVDKRIRRDVVQYLVKWQGYAEAENTWEDVDSLGNCKHLIKSYEAANKDRSTSNKRSASEENGSSNSKRAKKEANTGDDDEFDLDAMSDLSVDSDSGSSSDSGSESEKSNRSDDSSSFSDDSSSESSLESSDDTDNKKSKNKKKGSKSSNRKKSSDSDSKPTKKKKKGNNKKKKVATKEEIYSEEEDIGGRQPQRILDRRRRKDGREEFLMKFQHLSYREVEWLSKNWLLRKFPQMKKKAENFLEISDDAGVPPGATEIERIIDHKGTDNHKEYLVKWRTLTYEESTWEPIEDLKEEEDDLRIKEYHQLLKENEKRHENRSKNHSDARKQKPIEPPKFTDPDIKLKDYQVEGFKWLTYAWYQRRNSMLADEMGLGKTLQSISLLQYLRTVQDIDGPFLVVCPLSTLEHWRREINWSTNLRVVTMYGSKENRDVIKQHDWHAKDSNGKLLKGSYGFEVVVTSYEVIQLESHLFHKTDWECLILDEGHRIKNSESKSFEMLSRLKPKHKVLLTGTPLQNNTRELFSLLHFLDDEKFKSSAEFMEKFGEMNGAEQLGELQSLLAPYMLRRLKEDVDLTIPMKEETIVEVPLTSVQKAYYRAILDKNQEFLVKAVRSKTSLPKLLNIMMEIRKVCNHPYLIEGAEQYIVSTKNKGKTEKEAPEEYLIKSSAKMILLDKLLKMLKEGGHKVIIFSQMLKILDIIEDYLEYRNYSFQRIDGSIKGSDRQSMIDKFCEDKSCFAFLSTTRAGGLGINLTAADTVIIFDSDWNPQNDLQAQARAHRIGQKNNVKVYRLTTKDTYEKHMLEISARKLALGDLVLKGNSDPDKPPLDNEEVNKLLKFGAYHLYNTDISKEKEEENDAELLNEGIEGILQRASTVIYDNANKKGLPNLSKAQFIPVNEEVHDAIADRDFWEKTLPTHHSPSSLLQRFEAGLNTPEEKTAFLVDMEELVRSRQEQQELQDSDEEVYVPGAGQENITAANSQKLVTLLIKLEHSSIFSPTEKERIVTQRTLLEAPRLRQRSKTTSYVPKEIDLAESNSDSDFDESSSSSEESSSGEEFTMEDESPKKKKKRPSRAQSMTAGADVTRQSSFGETEPAIPMIKQAVAPAIPMMKQAVPPPPLVFPQLPPFALMKVHNVQPHLMNAQPPTAAQIRQHQMAQLMQSQAVAMQSQAVQQLMQSQAAQQLKSQQMMFSRAAPPHPSVQPIKQTVPRPIPQPTVQPQQLATGPGGQKVTAVPPQNTATQPKPGCLTN